MNENWNIDDMEVIMVPEPDYRKLVNERKIKICLDALQDVVIERNKYYSRLRKAERKNGVFLLAGILLGGTVVLIGKFKGIVED